MKHKLMMPLTLKKTCRNTKATSCRPAPTACCGRTPFETATSPVASSCSSVSLAGPHRLEVHNKFEKRLKSSSCSGFSARTGEMDATGVELFKKQVGCLSFPENFHSYDGKTGQWVFLDIHRGSCCTVKRTLRGRAIMLVQLHAVAFPRTFVTLFPPPRSSRAVPWWQAEQRLRRRPDPRPFSSVSWAVSGDSSALKWLSDWCSETRFL